jgi:hypothetical protein
MAIQLLTVLTANRQNYILVVNKIEAQIIANVAEYAAMTGISFDCALKLAETDYLDMLFILTVNFNKKAA